MVKIVDLGWSFYPGKGISAAGYILIAEGGEVVWFSGEPLYPPDVERLLKVAGEKEIFVYTGLCIEDEKIAKKLAEVLNAPLIYAPGDFSCGNFFIPLKKKGKVEKIFYEPDCSIVPLEARVVEEDDDPGTLERQAAG